MRQITSTNFIRIDNHKEIDIPIMMQKDTSNQEDIVEIVILKNSRRDKSGSYMQFSQLD